MYVNENNFLFLGYIYLTLITCSNADSVHADSMLNECHNAASLYTFIFICLNDMHTKYVSNNDYVQAIEL